MIAVLGALWDGACDVLGQLWREWHCTHRWEVKTCSVECRRCGKML